MTNIPRRKIYEIMLEYEDGLIDMNILNLSQTNFEEYVNKFNDESYSIIKESYFKLKALFLMFLEHKMYENEEQFDNELLSLLENLDSLDKKLKKNKNISKQFIQTYENVENMFKQNKKIETLKQSKDMFKILDEFNHEIPELLTIRRDKMK